MNINELKFTISMYLGDGAGDETEPAPEVWDALMDVHDFVYNYLSDDYDPRFLDVKELNAVAEKINEYKDVLEISYDHHNNRIDVYVGVIGKPWFHHVRIFVKSSTALTEEEMNDLTTRVIENNLI